MKSCRVPGCNLPAVGFSAYCATHKARQRRHGDPRQQGISRADIAPYVHRVQARVEKNRHNPVWAALEEQWASCVTSAEAVLVRFARGDPCVGHEIRAAQELKRIRDHVDAATVAHTGLAMFVVRELEPRRFQSDEAFKTQLVRRLRRLTDVNAGTWYDHETGKVKRAYRELPPRTAAIMAGWVIPVFGPLGIHLARLERKEQQATEEKGEAFRRSMEDLR